MSKSSLILEKNYKLQQSAETKTKIAELNDKIERATRIKNKLNDLKKSIEQIQRIFSKNIPIGREKIIRNGKRKVRVNS
ncbi:hypothetical protein KR888_12125 [Staphylococcus aureus]|uniref:hypothetical protein n=1 Tax=Staphylococcus aureus TaxID=1280 RepID=UPI001C1EC578|nr:hypothetical protein [Staphylococcus aureus]MBU7403185.1 hypothetical protein [Staphylococcus aureus]